MSNLEARNFLLWTTCDFRTVKIFPNCHFEVQDFTGGHVNKVYQHLPVADEPGFVCFSAPSAMSDNSSFSDKQKRIFFCKMSRESYSRKFDLKSFRTINARLNY